MTSVKTYIIYMCVYIYITKVNTFKIEFYKIMRYMSEYACG